MTRNWILLVSILNLCPIIGAAQPPDSAFGPRSFEYKSPRKAFGYSVGATLIPVAIAVAGNGRFGLAVAGIVVGPSAGYFYGGCGKRGFAGVLFRGGMLAASLPLARWAGQSSDDEGEWAGFGEAMTVVGVAAVFICVDAAYDVFHVERAVTERNDRIAKSVALIPLQSPTRGMHGFRICLSL